MFDAEIDQVIYVIGVFVFAAIFLNQYERWRRLRRELRDTRVELAALRTKNDEVESAVNNVMIEIEHRPPKAPVADKMRPPTK